MVFEEKEDDDLEDDVFGTNNFEKRPHKNVHRVTFSSSDDDVRIFHDGSHEKTDRPTEESSDEKRDIPRGTKHQRSSSTTSQGPAPQRHCVHLRWQPAEKHARPSTTSEESNEDGQMVPRRGDTHFTRSQGAAPEIWIPNRPCEYKKYTKRGPVEKRAK